jgi:hypothetical protein
MPKSKPHRNPNNREQDAMLHTIEELAVWLQQLKVLTAHREEYSREWAAAKMFGKILGQFDKRLRKEMTKSGHSPYMPHARYPLPPYDYKKKDLKGIEKTEKKLLPDSKKDKKKSKK